MSERRADEQTGGGPWPLLAFVAGVLVFLPTLRFDFAYDDLAIIRANALVHHPVLFLHLWLREYWGSAPGFYTGVIRPIATSSFALQWWLVGDRPGLFHAVNALLHGVNAALLFGLARRWLASDRAAGLAAMLFALHPLHVEAVANVVGRAELLATLFGLLAWHAHVAGPPSSRRVTATGALYLLALLSKEIAVTLPALFLADAWLFGRARAAGGGPLSPGPSPSEGRGDRGGAGASSGTMSGARGGRGRWWLGQAPMLGACAVALALYLALRLAVIGSLGTQPGDLMPQNPLTIAPLWSRLMTALAMLGFHWWLFAWPWPLRPDYSYNFYPIVASPLDPRFLVAVAILGALIALAIATRRRCPGVTLAVLIYLAAISVVSNVPFLVGLMLAERNLYLPSVGMCALAGAAGAAPWQRWPRALPGLAVLGLTLAALTVIQSLPWRDTHTLFLHAAETTPESAAVWSNLASTHIDRASGGLLSPAERETELRAAEACADRALEIWPDYLMGHLRLAVAANLRGDIDTAARELDIVLAGVPFHRAALQLRLEIIRARGDLDRLDPLLDAALSAEPRNPIALEALARWRLDQGRIDEARDAIERLIAEVPHSTLGWIQVAQIRQAAGDREGAAAALREAERWQWLLEAEGGAIVR